MSASRWLALTFACLAPTATLGDFLETWESPAISEIGGITNSLPSPWTRFSGGSYDALVARPTDTYAFPQINPLASPAGGNQFLQLIGVNTGVSRMSGVTIAADTVYTLSAAIGHSRLSNDSKGWSLQLWADANGNGAFDGSSGAVPDLFIGQQHGEASTAVNAASGSWATNSYVFDSSTRPDLVGLQLIVFLNNFGSEESFYDDVLLLGGSPNAVPEPASLAMLALGAATVGLAARRSRRGA